MKRRYLIHWVIFLGLVFLIDPLYAQDNINLTDEELAKESVLPLFEDPQSVRNRNVAKSGVFSLYPLGGIIINNPFFQSYPVGGAIGYHFNEFHSVYILGAYLFSIKTKYSDQLSTPGEITQTHPYFQDFDIFPQENILALGMYEFSPLYGKMSFTKDLVLHTDLLLSAGIGTIVFDTTSPLFATTLGLGQRFYFGKKWGIRFDLMNLLYMGPYYIGLGPNTQRLSEYDIDLFPKKLAFYLIFSAGLVVYL